MQRLTSFCAAALALSATTPALAHITASPQAHWHTSDVLGLLAVAALTSVAVWLGRRDR